MPIPPVPPELVAAVKRNTAIAFAGSGMSIPAGAPSWTEFLYELIAVAEARAGISTEIMRALECVYSNRMLDAANIACQVINNPIVVQDAVVRSINKRRTFNQIDHASLSAALRQGALTQRLMGANSTYADRNLRPTKSHTILTQLNLRAIVTTNYDRLFEAVLGANEIASHAPGAFKDGPPVRPWDRFILHLHGDIHHRNDIAVTLSQCQGLAHGPAYLYVQSFFTLSTTLWLGYGFSESDVFNLLGAGLGASNGFILLLRHRDEVVAARAHELKLQILWVDSQDEIEEFLRNLADETDDRRRATAQPDAGPDAGLRVNYVLLLNYRSGTINKHFLAGPWNNVPSDLIDPDVVVRDVRKPFMPDELFSEWSTRPDGRGKKFAIVAPPAAGKTVLLSRFAHWLNSRFKEGNATNLAPVIFFLTADSLPDLIEGEKTLLEQVEARVDGATGSFHNKPGLLNPWLETGSAYLLFDGLDEFGARRSGELENLLNALSGLADNYGISVFLTCREVFWSQVVQEPGKSLWEPLKLRAFTSQQIHRMLGGNADLIPFAFDAGRPRPGVLNHLVAGFAVTLGKTGRQEPFMTRFDLFRGWAEHAVQVECLRIKSDISWEDWLRVFRSTALRLLRELATSTGMPALPDGRIVPFHQCLAMNILVPSADRIGIKFYHESLNEFFVAWGLMESFRKVVTPSFEWDQGVALPLASVDLDFPQSSVYGFLHEGLGAGYIGDLLKTFRRLGVPRDALLIQLLRNLVEFIGMTYAGAPDRQVIDCLLQLMRMEVIDPTIRYNAARALERIHPWAPTPYFSYMSDFGGRDWTKEQDLAREMKLRPWAIRGYHIEDGKLEGRKPGDKPSLLVSAARAFPETQEFVSGEVGAMLIALLNQPTVRTNPDDVSPEECLRINYSHTWVRWYHPRHQKLRDDALRLAKDHGARQEVVANLNTWISHDGFNPPLGIDEG